MSQENIETKLLINIGWGMFGYISFASMAVGFPRRLVVTLDIIVVSRENTIFIKYEISKLFDR